MSSRFIQARWLALSIQSGAWERSAITDRLTRVLSTDFADSIQLTARLCFHFDTSSPPAIDPLVAFLLNEPLLDVVFESEAIQGPLLDSPVMGEKPDRLVTFPLPALTTWKDVGLWLGLRDKEIAWFADSKAQQSRVVIEKLHHYRYTWVPKRTGEPRLIEIPKSRLKEIQRLILKDILNRIPPHPCAHGFCRGRSIKTFVAPHIGQEAVLRLDLKDFFHSVPTARIGALFRHLGYPGNIAWLLQGFCTNAISPSLAGEPFKQLPWSVRKRLQSKHLPQGAPTSPQLANLCAWRLDCRLQGLASRLGFQYTRYADDMAFSGTYKLAAMSKFMEELVGGIAIEEGFQLNYRKTRLRLSSQRQCLAGVIVNELPNCRRKDWDQLKAILHNCIKYGPESQNRDGVDDFKAHLYGRLTYFSWLNPSRGKKLLNLWDRIVWDK
ncbi:MAG: reverse transcriptase family protein [Chromatiales bacterium]|nr:reverse transcriptase family protein [Chromatiales bacterium]